MTKTDDEYKKTLSPMQFAVTRQKHTEPPFSGAYWDHWDKGKYTCICCGAELFSSENKFDAGCGWPSYDRASVAENVKEARDTSHFMVRTEILCSHCDAHLGHVFPDGPTDTGLRYCVNSASVAFKAEEDAA
ncbi:MAG: peptide-methionine (R)-S-oxide reductase [Betaproteobacteria bacterium]|nr:peptide-methionine (R)-S-oxide reductase [Betaproteobacteria bacterium]NBT75838.1 peptide-methionine (R)-S-oxide reductase [Betaproteobacteria bacterium]NBY13854.1 peptide-methionine (R)-S-oxide reductase [Betaproteobacteria bacterium]NCA16111.1 peptide-methionine (R)-S-oxide reductase [Betaproteobacteria bacterium]